MAEHEPHTEEYIQRHVGHARHRQQIVVVMEIYDVISVPPNLLPQEEDELEDSETSTDDQVDREFGLARTLAQVVHTCRTR